MVLPTLTVLLILFTCTIAQVFRAPETQSQNVQDFRAPNSGTRESRTNEFRAPTNALNNDRPTQNVVGSNNNNPPVSFQAPIPAQRIVDQERVREVRPEQERVGLEQERVREVGPEQERVRGLERERALMQQIVELQERERALRQELQRGREQEQVQRVREVRPEQREVVPERERVQTVQEARQAPADDALCNPVTGFRARTGGIYAAVLNGMGVRSGNCGSSPRPARAPEVETQTNPSGLDTTPRRRPTTPSGPVNPITGFRARPGGIYATVLNMAGVQNDNGEAQQGRGVGLFGNSRLVQAINARGGLIAAADQNSVMPSQQAAAAIPSWAIACIVLACVVVVALIAVLVQLFFLVRRS